MTFFYCNLHLERQIYVNASTNFHVLVIYSHFEKQTEFNKGNLKCRQYNVFIILFFIIKVDVYNVSLIPSDDPMTVTEGTQRLVWCVVNRNAVPTPTINWYMGSLNITSIAEIDKASITITGNRSDNAKTLACRASNSAKPPALKTTTLNVECQCSFCFRSVI